MTKFQQAVVNVVNMIPYGKVVSYGQVAAYVGIPRGARQVGWTLRSLEGEDIPWWRVINNLGRITIKGNRYNTPQTQRDWLVSEGIVVDDDFNIEIERYRYLIPFEDLKQFGLDQDYVDYLHTKLLHK